jgi:hypothetical protein
LKNRLLFAAVLIGSPLIGQAVSFASDCTTKITQFLEIPEMQVCAACHRDGSTIPAPKWSSSPASFIPLWNSHLERNISPIDNILIQKAFQSGVIHAGGKSFPAETKDQIADGLERLGHLSCINFNEKKDTRIRAPFLPKFGRFRNRIVSMVGEDSAAIMELGTYGKKLGAFDYKTKQSSTLQVDFSTAPILERIIALTCQQITNERNWRTTFDKNGSTILGEFITEATGIGNEAARLEAERIHTHILNSGNKEVEIASCAVVLRSEAFLLQ